MGTFERTIDALYRIVIAIAVLNPINPAAAPVNPPVG
jgi:hypothetical protein